MQPFHLSGIVHTAAFKQANQIFTLCVFALLYDSTHNTVAFSPTLHKNTTGVLPHRPTTVRPAALLLPCLCFHHSVQRLPSTPFSTRVSPLWRNSSGFPSSLKNIFVVKEMEEMEVVLMDFSSVFALITSLNPSVIQLLYITHTHERMHTVIGTPNHISAVPSSRSPHSTVSASENEMYSTAHTPCKRKSPFLFFSEENKLACILPHLMSTHMPVQRPSTHPWPRELSLK